MKGYGRLRLADITSAANISHQAFYGHFANKRHAVAVATSEELGVIADMAMRGAKRGEEWAKRMLEDLDRTLAATYPVKDGPELWLRKRIVEALAEPGGFGSLRILELIKISTLGHGEFYRRYGGKRGCLRRIYADALSEIEQEIGDRVSIAALVAAIGSEPGRARLLALGCPYLPDGREAGEGKATRSSLGALVSEVVAADLGVASDGQKVVLISGGILELLRAAVLQDRLERLPTEAEAFAELALADANPASAALAA